MSGRRKRDDLETGELYRVVQRAAGSDDEWEHSNYGTYGRPRTYMTLGAARAQKTSFERAHREHVGRGEFAVRPAPERLEFAVQRAPVTAWEVVPDPSQTGTRERADAPPER